MNNIKNVVVTGAAGYIGRHVVKTLLDRGLNVTAVDFTHKDIDERATYSDVTIFSGEKDLYEQLGKPDLCIHMAWKDGFIHNSNAHMENLSAHFTFINTLINGGCKNISVMGTMHEIGFWEGAVDAKTPCSPLSQYGIAKNALRQSLLQLTKDKDVNLYWLRAFYILGDDYKNSSIFSKILAAARDGKKQFPFTTGKNQYDFIHVDELAKQIVAASLQDKYTGIINVCSGKAVSLADKVEKFIKENNLEITLQYGAFPERPYDSTLIYGDNSIIQEILSNDDKSF